MLVTSFCCASAQPAFAQLLQDLVRLRAGGPVAWSCSRLASAGRDHFLDRRARGGSAGVATGGVTGGAVTAAGGGCRSAPRRRLGGRAVAGASGGALSVARAAGSIGCGAGSSTWVCGIESGGGGGAAAARFWRPASAPAPAPRAAALVPRSAQDAQRQQARQDRARPDRRSPRV